MSSKAKLYQSVSKSNFLNVKQCKTM